MSSPVAWSSEKGMGALSFDLAARMRHETVEVSGQEAKALTTKLRLDADYTLNLVSAKLQVDHVANAFRGKHSDGVVVGGLPVIADPRGTEINQAFLRLDLTNTEITLGRQSLTFDDHRFIGDVSFRQNDQTYDALQLKHKTLNGWAGELTYVGRVNRIFGRDAHRHLSTEDIRHAALNGKRPAAQLGVHRVDGVWFNLTKQLHDYVEIISTISNLQNHDHAPFSNRTVMIGANIDYKPRKVKWQSSLILATQKRQQLVSPEWLSFSRIELSATEGAYKLSYRQEIFGSKRGQAFVTPLATLHKFQGWTDQFLSTPADGLTDRSVLLRWRSLPLTVDARYHWFESEATKAEIGTEFNVDFILKPSSDHELKLRYANFDPANSAQFGQPTRKIFLMYSYQL